MTGDTLATLFTGNSQGLGSSVRMETKDTFLARKHQISLHLFFSGCVTLPRRPGWLKQQKPILSPLEPEVPDQVSRGWACVLISYEDPRLTELK